MFLAVMEINDVFSSKKELIISWNCPFQSIGATDAVKN
jgi:hypothetical protein